MGNHNFNNSKLQQCKQFQQKSRLYAFCKDLNPLKVFKAVQRSPTRAKKISSICFWTEMSKVLQQARAQITALPEEVLTIKEKMRKNVSTNVAQAVPKNSLVDAFAIWRFLIIHFCKEKKMIGSQSQAIN